MRYFLLTPIAILFLFSCNQNVDQSSQEQTNYRIVFEDTMRIDSKGELLFVNNSLSTSSFLPTTDKLYNFDLKNYGIEVYDIEKAEFVTKYPFESDGPNAVGRFITGFQVRSEDEIYIFDINFFGKYNLSGERISKIDLKDIPTFDGDTLQVNERAMPGGGFYKDQFITTSSKDFIYQGVLFLNFDKQEMRKELTPEFDKASELRFMLQLDQSRIPQGPAIRMNVLNDMAILSCDSYNEVIIYDLLNDTRTHRKFTSTIMPNEKVAKHSSPIIELTRDDLSALALLNDQITFGQFYFDDVNKLFYRISYMSNGLEGDQRKLRYFLSIFDKDLNHLQDIGDLPDDFPLSFLFIRNGKMYSFLNENDEIALTIMSVVAE